MSTTESMDTAIDRESRMKDTDHEALRLWLRLLTCTNLVENSIRSELRRAFDCTLPRFDLMAQLERHPKGLRMGEQRVELPPLGGGEHVEEPHHPFLMGLGHALEALPARGGQLDHECATIVRRRLARDARRHGDRQAGAHLGAG